MLDTNIKLAWIIKSLVALCTIPYLADAGKIEMVLDLKCQKDIICILWWGGGRISENLLENDSLCYLSSGSLADSYQEERELTVHHQEKKICESDFPLLLPFPNAWDPLPKMKRIKLLSLSLNKHKLFWHLINRQCGIVLKARQVCLPQWWWIPLFCMESLLAFLSYVLTHLSPEREKFERWPKVITHTLPWCCCHVFSPAHHH